MCDCVEHRSESRERAEAEEKKRQEEWNREMDERLQEIMKVIRAHKFGISFPIFTQVGYLATVTFESVILAVTTELLARVSTPVPSIVASPDIAALTTSVPFPKTIFPTVTATKVS